MKPGDKVLIKLEDESLEGIYLEKPALLGSDTVIIKLENGYNIGIDKEKIKDMKVLEEYIPKKSKPNKITQNPKLPNITIISTGGTISSKLDYTTGGVVAAYTAEDFLEMCPELLEIANIKALPILNKMSEDFHSEDWEHIAKAVINELPKCDGIVITTGTDTLGYTAAALGFMCKVNKPVIITAAQRSIDRPSTDAFFNLVCAVNAAANFDASEIAVCMHEASSDEYCNLLRATKVKKMHTSKRDAFTPINTHPLAKVTPTSIEPLLEVPKRSKAKPELKGSFKGKVAIIYIHPTMDPSVLKHYQDHDGVILMGTGLGHIPNYVYNALKELVANTKFVGMTSQCINGRVSPTVYSNLRKVSIGIGVTYLEDMLAETALVKLKWALSQTQDKEKLKEIMLENIAHEFNKRIDLE